MNAVGYIYRSGILFIIIAMAFVYNGCSRYNGPPTVIVEYHTIFYTSMIDTTLEHACVIIALGDSTVLVNFNTDTNRIDTIFVSDIYQIRITTVKHIQRNYAPAKANTFTLSSGAGPMLGFVFYNNSSKHIEKKIISAGSLHLNPDQGKTYLESTKKWQYVYPLKGRQLVYLQVRDRLSYYIPGD
jgi:hypothetical protein